MVLCVEVILSLLRSAAAKPLVIEVADGFVHLGVFRLGHFVERLHPMEEILAGFSFRSDLPPSI